MISGYTTSYPCPGPCDRCGRLSLFAGDCDDCAGRKIRPARPLPRYVVSHTKDGAARVRRVA